MKKPNKRRPDRTCYTRKTFDFYNRTKKYSYTKLVAWRRS